MEDPEIISICDEINSIRDKVRTLMVKYNEMSYKDFMNSITELKSLLPWEPMIMSCKSDGDDPQYTYGEYGVLLYVASDSSSILNDIMTHNSIEIVAYADLTIHAFKVTGQSKFNGEEEWNKEHLCKIDQTSNYYMPIFAIHALVSLLNKILDKGVTTLCEVQLLRRKLEAFELA